MSQLGRNLSHLVVAPRALRALSRLRPGVPANLRAVRRVAFFPRLGLAFNRIKKNANTSLMILLSELEAEAAARAGAAGPGAGPVGDLPPGALIDRSVATLFDLGAEDLARLDRFHFFVVVRNPYGRVLSAFLDKFRHPDWRRRHGAFPLTPEGFGAFLDWLERGGLTRDLHWTLQTRLMLFPPAVQDSVIRFEALRDETLAMLAGCGIAAPAEALAARPASDRDKETAADARLAGFYTPARAGQVARLYAPDFAALGYDTAFPVAPVAS